MSFLPILFRIIFPQNLVQRVSRLVIGGFLLLSVLNVLNAQVYVPPMPSSLIGYEVRRDFLPEIKVAVERILPNGTIYLAIMLKATRAQEMKVSLDPNFQNTPWEKYQTNLQEWRVSPQEMPLTVYAVFKRKNVDSRRGSSVSTVAHYTLDLKNTARVLERTAYGYMDWSDHVLFIEEQYGVAMDDLSTVRNQTQRLREGNLSDPATATLTVGSHVERNAERELQIRALEDVIGVRVSPYVTIGDLITLERVRRENLTAYLSLLNLEEIRYRSSQQIGGGIDPLSDPRTNINRRQGDAPYTPYSPEYGLSELVLEATLSLLAYPVTAFGESHPTLRPLYAAVQPQLRLPEPVDLEAERFSSERYTQLVLDLRGQGYSPTLYPRVVSPDGKVILSAALYEGRKQPSPSPAFSASAELSPQGSSRKDATFTPNHIRPPTETILPYARYIRAGDLGDVQDDTLFVRAEDVIPPLRDIVISSFYAQILLSDALGREKIANGGFVIIVD